MKKKKLLAIAFLAPLMLGAVTSCGGNKASGSGVIRIKMYKGGIGKDWLEAIIGKFKSYQSKVKGKNVDVIIDDFSKGVGTKAQQEILNVQGDTDLYLLSGLDVHNVIRQSEARLGTDEIALLEPFDDILEEPAIRFDGTVETKTIGQRLNGGYKDVCTYNTVTNDKWNGYTFGLPWLGGISGIICNVEKLNKMGYEVPLTSDQFVDVVKGVYTKGGTSGVKPFVYSGANAPGYWNYLYDTWLAQAMGMKEMSNFIACTPHADSEQGIIGDGSRADITKNGWAVYTQNEKAFEMSLDPMVQIMKNEYMITNSSTASYGVAQGAFADGKAVFMVNGDWLLKEMKESDTFYYDEMKNFNMIRTPILSSLGTDIGLSSDEELQQLVKLIDNHTSHAEIISAMEGKVTEEGIKRIEEARSVYISEGGTHLMFTPSFSDAKSLTKEFIRFMYSNDACNLFSKYNYSSLPLEFDLDSSSIVNNYQKSVNMMFDSTNPTMYCERGEVNEVRALGKFYYFNKTEWAGPTSTFIEIMNNKSGWTASYIAKEEVQTNKSKWQTYMNNIGWK